MNTQLDITLPDHKSLLAEILDVRSPLVVRQARPSAEPLFATVAEVYRKNAIAVVLTGGDGDGSMGVQIIKDHGGKVIAQNQATSQNFSMPQTSIDTGDVDFIHPLDKIAPQLIRMVAACADPA